MAIYYVRKSGSDFNDGRSAAAAWGTLNKALRGGSGSFTAGSSTTLTTTGLTADQWIGATVTILTGTGAGSTGVVTANSTTVFTVASWSGTAPSGAGTYAVTHLASGDTLYIGAGHYRESVTLTLTNPTSPVYIFGDPLGLYTGDAGEVLWSGGMHGNSAGQVSVNLCSLNGRNNINLKNITFMPYNSTGIVNLGSETGFRLSRCVFPLSNASLAVALTISAGVVANHTIEECIFYGFRSQIVITPALHTTDYDMNIVVTKCIGLSPYPLLALSSATGTGAGKPGGVRVSECTNLVHNIIYIYNVTNYSVTIPCSVRDCYAGSLLIDAGPSGTVGQVVDLGGNMSTGLAGVPANPKSYHMASHPLPFSVGHEWLYGLPPKKAFTPYPAYLFPLGTSAISATDVTGRSRTEGSSRLITTGTVTGATTNIITDGNKSFGTNELKTYWLVMLTGTQAGVEKYIVSNTSTQITVYATGAGNEYRSSAFAIAPDVGDQYAIYEGYGEEISTLTSATATSFTDNNSYLYTRWNSWFGSVIEITGGLGVGQKRTVYYGPQGNINLSVLNIQGGTLHTISTTGTVTGGTFNLQFKEKITTPIAYNATAATIQTALEALSTIGVGNVTCSGGPLPSTPVSVTFTGTLASNQEEPLIGVSRLTGSSPSLWVVGNWTTTPNNTSTYVMYRRADRALIAAQPGAIVTHDTAQIETAVTDQGTGIRLVGFASHEFQIPVKANQATTVSVKTRFNGSYQPGIKPQLMLPAQDALGLSVQTATMTAAADTWETISLTFTPTTTGVAVIRVIAQATTPYGAAYFDSFSIT